ncbi:MAG: nickel-dependent lactate racemase [Candidatus Bathyarchaeota archaeon]|nr:nickel-dependent lactate racemase [Candidatus Bathyarchaeota archaeon]
MQYPGASIPKMIRVRQKIRAPKIDDYISALRRELNKAGLREKIKPGAKIAIAVGSRGISHIAEIVATVVDEVKRAGGEPFIVPAMGSHGGATPEGQIAVLESLGVTRESVGAPVRATMEVEEVGRLSNGAPVYVDRFALNSDGIIVINRIKPHTDFKGRIESGLMKMMVIGLGKQKGAEVIHRYQLEGYHKLIPEAARIIMEKARIILGVAVVENARHEIAVIRALRPEEIEEEEAKLLEIAKDLMARIPFKEIDVLIVDEMGKNISGTGMDTNVIGRFWTSPEEYEPRAPKIKRIVVLDLTEESNGNAVGIGLADITTERLVSKIDFEETFVNCFTSTWPETAKIPPFLPNDRDAILMAIRCCGPIDPQKAKIVRIKNTLELEYMWISESLYEAVKRDKDLSESLEILGEPEEMQFDVLGNLAR